MENQEEMLKLSLIGKQSQELEEKIGYVSQQIAELEELNTSLSVIEDSKSSDSFSSIGRGIFVKSSIPEKKLFINTGAGVLVKKTPQEAKEIIESQIKNFHELKSRLLAEFEVYQNFLEKTLSGMKNRKK